MCDIGIKMQLFDSREKERENENLVKSFKNHSVEITYIKKLNVTSGHFFFYSLYFFF